MQPQIQDLRRYPTKAAISMTNLTANREGWAKKLEKKEKAELEAYTAAITDNFEITHLGTGESAQSFKDNSNHFWRVRWTTTQ